MWLSQKNPDIALPVQTIRHQLAYLYADSFFRSLYTYLKMKIIPFEQFSQFLPKRGVILEVGCGYGYVANYLSLESSDRIVIGNDPAKDRIEVAQMTVRDRKNIQFFTKDCRELGINNLDGVVIADVLHHVPFSEQKKILADVYTRLKSGGSLVMRETDIRIGLRYLLFNYLSEYLLYIGKEKLNFRKAKDWREILESIGFQVNQVIPNSPFFPYITALFICIKTEGPRK